MSTFVKVLVRGERPLMLEGGRALPYQPTEISNPWWGLHASRLGRRVVTVEQYEAEICKASAVDLRAECLRRDMPKSGTVHEMRARLLDGIAPYHPRENSAEDTEDTDKGGDPDLVEQALDASKDRLKEIAKEAGVEDADGVDFRRTVDDVREAIITAMTEDTDDEQDSDSPVAERGEDD